MMNLSDGFVPSMKDFDAVLQFMPLLEEPKSTALFWREGDNVDYEKRKLTVGVTVYAEELVAFVASLYEHGFVQMFEWSDWHQEAERYFAQQELIAKADLQTCIKLLTYHVRSDRFTDGHLAHMISSGHIAQIMFRLRDLRDGING
jgi:hypothetical protein